VAILVALIPFLPGLSNARVFYLRDLSQAFWGRHLWLRRSWLSGEWPLWDPFVGAGQAAYSDALNQMFLPPAVLARLVGGEMLGFNLWIALPFPLAAAGAWLFFSRRFSAAAALMGAIAFAVCGPVVSTGNTPNLSWSAAAVPWALWAADRLVCAPNGRNVAILAASIALQALAGEPVTLFTTLCLVLVYAATRGDATGANGFAHAARSLAGASLGVALGLFAAAVQLLPMVLASSLANRSDTIGTDVWSLRPTALIETAWPHLFGNYFETRTLADVPWMPLMYTGRAPLLFSIYLGVPLLTLAVFGLAGPGHRRWRLFWVAAGLVSLVASFGAYTPIYPILRDHVPPFNLFRFPVKYFIVTAAAVAAGAAAGWDSLAGRRLVTPCRRGDILPVVCGGVRLRPRTHDEFPVVVRPRIGRRAGGDRSSGVDAPDRQPGRDDTNPRRGDGRRPVRHDGQSSWTTGRSGSPLGARDPYHRRPAVSCVGHQPRARRGALHAARVAVIRQDPA